jgi:hypothetical protein
MDTIKQPSTDPFTSSFVPRVALTFCHQEMTTADGLEGTMWNVLFTFPSTAAMTDMRICSGEQMAEGTEVHVWKPWQEAAPIITSQPGVQQARTIFVNRFIFQKP